MYLGAYLRSIFYPPNSSRGFALLFRLDRQEVLILIYPYIVCVYIYTYVNYILYLCPPEGLPSGPVAGAVSQGGQFEVHRATVLQQLPRKATQALTDYLCSHSEEEGAHIGFVSETRTTADRSCVLRERVREGARHSMSKRNCLCHHI